jgi:kynurenine formamidase
MTPLTRRHLIGAAGLLAAAPTLTLAQNNAQSNAPANTNSGPDRSKAPRTTSRARDLTDAELESMFQRCSNAGRWGADDELGTLNYITPQKRVAAAKLVKTGQVISAGRDLSTVQSKVDSRPMQHMIMHDGNGVSLSDFITLAPHGMSVTHLDALCHFSLDERFYNNRKRTDTVNASGAKWGSIQAMRQGIFTRCVLLDVAAARDVPWYKSDEYVTVADFEAAEKKQNVRVESGDAIFVRTGMERMEREQGVQDVYPRAGLHAECVEWMHKRQVSVYGGDCIEKLPYPSDRFTSALHIIALVAMGLPILDWPALTELTQTCNQLQRWDFLLTTAPLRLPGGTSSPLNPLCAF